MGLATYVARRVLFSFFVIIGELLIIFYLTNIAAPNPAVIWAGPESTKAQVALVAQMYHLNSPWYVQFYYYMINVFTGNWGISPLYQQPVISLIEEYLPVTLELTIIAFVFKIGLEMALGVVSAMRPNGAVDNVIKVTYTTVRSAPPFLVALGLLLLFAYGTHTFPSSQPIDPILGATVPKFQFYNPIAGRVTGFWLVDNMPILNALLVGDWAAFSSAVSHAVLPTVTLILFGFGGIVRLVKVSMLEVLDQDYVRTARAKGLRESAVIFKHALRNSLLPAFTLMGVVFAGLVTGSLVVETIYGYYGLGYYVAESLITFDTPSLIGTLILITVVIIISNLVVDIGYGFLDPRTRVGY
ncbi:MAG: ABC transporter permease [Nitrososphaerota archaeon]|nr:ABC transporter permease [Nitrososphaerota archaeon]MDG6965916.1 ABC transporter permease [Nitrososphaerota archaeon]MDG6982643.1 ABC transporter permease [Nitrososphaerota archaeon]